MFAPSVLAFPYQSSVGDDAIYSVAPIDATALARIEARASGRVAASPIAEAHEPRRLFLTDGGWRWRWLAGSSQRAFAITRPLTGNVIVNQTDIIADRVTTGRSVAGVRSLSGVIAHEKTHGAIQRRYGLTANFTYPEWLVEGYCDYVAGEGSLDDATARRLRQTDRDHPALVYYDGRRRVAAILAANGGSVDQLFSGAR